MSHLSFEGQTPLEYCIECAVKHGQTGKVLIREALQRAKADGVSSEGVKEKIKGVVEELTGLENDTDAVENRNVIELNNAARELRKHVYSSKSEIGGADLETLEEIKKKLDSLVDQTYKVREEEEICVSCVSFVCEGNEDCMEFLEKAAESGNKKNFLESVEKAKKHVWEIPKEKETSLEEYGKSVAEKRQKFLQEIKNMQSPA